MLTSMVCKQPTASAGYSVLLALMATAYRDAISFRLWFRCSAWSRVVADRFAPQAPLHGTASLLSLTQHREKLNVKGRI